VCVAAAAAAGSAPTVLLFSRGRPTQLCYQADYNTYAVTTATDCAPVDAAQYAYSGRRMPDGLKMEDQLYMHGRI